MPITIKNSAGGGVTLDSTTSNNETVNLPTGGGTLVGTATPSFTGNATITSGNLVIATAGKGLAVGGTGAANTLDDYEEGTWTPSLGGNTGYSIQSGQYTKIGRLVFVQGLLSVGTLGTGSATTVTGLPFPANNVSSSNQGGSITFFANLAVNVITPTTYVPDNGSALQIQSRVSAGTSITSAAIFGNSARIDFSITYETDS